MPERLRARIRNALAHSRVRIPEPVLRALWRGYEGALVLRGRFDRGSRPIAGTDDGLPVPPPALRVLVSGGPDPVSFLDSGRAHSEFIRSLLADNAVEIESLGAMLDLGCGCGRIARWWRDLRGPTVYACDYNPRLAGWCRTNLPFLRVSRNELLPPLPYDDDSFDLVYALSVFTHLTEEQQELWMPELRRVLRPGGLLIFTVNGEAYADRLSTSERERFDSGRIVTRFEDVAGTNMCATYHPPQAVGAGMLDGFRLLDAVRPTEQPERTPEFLAQDTYLVRRGP